MNYIVFDLEATCWDIEKKMISEVIEIGAVRLNPKMEKTGEFQMFVQPVINPVLSPFCQKLTGIKQEQVRSAQKFPEVTRLFQEWIGDKYWLCSWGFYDRKKMKDDCILHKMPYDWTSFHISIKHQYATLRKERPCGIIKALRDFQWKFEGQHHRALEDARNISRIFKAVYPALRFEKS